MSALGAARAALPESWQYEPPAAHLRSALTLLELLELEPEPPRALPAEVLTFLDRRAQLAAVTMRVEMALGQVEHGDRRVSVLASLLNTGGLEFVPRGTTDTSRALLARAVEHITGADDSGRGALLEQMRGLLGRPADFLAEQAAELAGQDGPTYFRAPAAEAAEQLADGAP